MTSAFWFPIAAILEIAGCFSFWAWLRLERSAIWLIPGMVALAGFAWVLTQVEASFAGRAYAAYGGVYIAASLIWGSLVEKQAPSIVDLAGAFICLVGASLIFLGPRLMRQ
ncbi:MAG: YnfA family protein [Alcanivoracaceae bacterium]|nr:YnfA family protein [Alcanivoracaceae bacterium]